MCIPARSTRIELYLPTLLGVLSSYYFICFISAFLHIQTNISTVGIELKDQRYY